MYDPAKEEYLGDGLYVSFNGESFVLRAPRINCDHWVALDFPMLVDLINYANYIMKEIEDERRHQSK